MSIQSFVKNTMPENVEVEPNPPFRILKETENKRPIVAVRNKKDTPAECISCGQVVQEDVLIGVQYTYDQNKYTALCVSCSRALGIVGEDVEPTPHVGVTERSAPVGDTTKPRNKTEKGDKKNMGLLKAKKTTAASAATTAPEQRVTDLIVSTDLNTSLELDIDEDTDEEDFAAAPTTAPWNEETTTTPTNPADLRARIDAVNETPSVVPTTAAATTTYVGITKADVDDIVKAAIAEAVKEITTHISKSKTEVKTEINKSVSIIQQEDRDNFNVLVENLSLVGTHLKELTDKLEAALSDEEEETPAPAPTTSPAPPTAAKTTTTTKSAAPSTPPAAAPVKAESKSSSQANRPRFEEYVRQFVGEDGARLEDLADALCSNNYFKTAPDDRSRLLSDLTTLLNNRGYTVADYFVTKQEQTAF